MTRPKDVNSPSPWNVRVWDEENHEWLCQSDPNSIVYYGFDIRGGEVTSFQGIDWVYKQHARWDKLVWERSTDLQDMNGVEIYEGDIVEMSHDGDLHKVGIIPAGVYFEALHDGYRRYHKDYRLDSEDLEVIGDIHENPGLLKEAK